MATGAGKTRTVIALVDLLMRANWVKRVLFLADRMALVNQAVNAFKAHLPDAAPVNLVTERDAEGRVYVSTYPTMMGLIDETDERPAAVRRRATSTWSSSTRRTGRCTRSTGRSSTTSTALLVGLTATPKDEIDRNTYSLFDLENGVPTDAYGLDEAVQRGLPGAAAGGLGAAEVPARGHPLRRPVSEEEKDQWDALEWDDDGDVPDSVDAEAVNKWLFNADTVDKVLAHLMTHGHKVAGGDRLGKTIIFAKNQAHAEFIAGAVRRQLPAATRATSPGSSRYQTEYAQSLIDDFSIKDKAAAHRDLGGHARHRHRRARGRQPGVLQARSARRPSSGR